MSEKKRTSRDKLLDVTFDEVYRYGYCGAATASILKKAGVPRGSMYHHFSSKKALVMAMIEERLSPKVRAFFDVEIDEALSAERMIDVTIKKIAKNSMLIKYGCPLHRLMFEMGALDDEIASACEKEFDYLVGRFEKVLLIGIAQGYIKEGDAKAMAEFFITSSWGILSRTPKSSSKEQFLKDMEFVMMALRA